MNIGLTGSIATGKSTVSAMLVERGALLIDADQISRDVVLPGHPNLDKIVEAFGQAVILEDGTLNRKKLGEIIFNNTEARKELEGILHPSIRETMLLQMKEWETKHPERLVVVDIPLLFESKLQGHFSEIMLVYVPEDIQLKRLMKRDDLSEIEARKRMNLQMSIEDKKGLADIVIDNSGTIEATEAQINDFWQKKRLK